MITIKFSRPTEGIFILVGGKQISYSFLPNSSITFDEGLVHTIHFVPCLQYDKEFALRSEN